MASRRCFLRLLSNSLLPCRPQSIAPSSIVARTLTSSPQPLVPITPRALTSLRSYPSRCHFATRSSFDVGDEEDHYEDEGSEDEWGDEEAVAAKKPSGKTEEEKVAEAAEVGYKVVPPLGSDEKPFKPYEPVFAIVQACSI
jgi:large subunit ribosomal protein L21